MTQTLRNSYRAKRERIRIRVGFLDLGPGINGTSDTKKFKIRKRGLANIKCILNIFHMSGPRAPDPDPKTRSSSLLLGLMHWYEPGSYYFRLPDPDHAVTWNGSKCYSLTRSEDPDPQHCIALVCFKTPKFVFILLRFGKKKIFFSPTFIISSKYNRAEQEWWERFNVKSS